MASPGFSGVEAASAGGEEEESRTDLSVGQFSIPLSAQTPGVRFGLQKAQPSLVPKLCTPGQAVPRLSSHFPFQLDELSPAQPGDAHPGCLAGSDNTVLGRHCLGRVQRAERESVVPKGAVRSLLPPFFPQSHLPTAPSFLLNPTHLLGL